MTTNNSTNRSNIPGLAMGYGGNGSEYIMPLGTSPSATTGALTVSKIWLAPMMISQPYAFTAMGVEVTTLAAGSSVRLGIYNSDDTGGLPGTLLIDVGVTVTTSTGDATLSISNTLHGAYWLAVISTVLAPTVRFGSLTGSIGIWGTNASQSNTATGCTLNKTSVASYYTALPGTLAGTAWSGFSSGPIIFLKS